MDKKIVNYSFEYPEITKCEECPLFKEVGFLNYECPLSGYGVANIFKKDEVVDKYPNPEAALSYLYKICPLKKNVE